MHSKLKRPSLLHSSTKGRHHRPSWLFQCGLFFVLATILFSGYSLVRSTFFYTAASPAREKATPAIQGKVSDARDQDISPSYRFPVRQPIASASPRVALPPATPKPVPLPQKIAVAGPPLGRILMYHYIRSDVDPAKDPLGYRLSITPQALDAQLTALEKAGYHSTTMSQLVVGKGGVKPVVLTFDDGYEDFYTAAYPLLKQHGFTATLYIISGKIGGPYMTWDQLKELQAAGFEIGAHTVNHPDLSTLSPEKQRMEIFGSKQAIEANLGTSVVSFCYPSGRYNQTSVQLVKEAGFTSATTTQPGIASRTDNPLLLPRIRVSPSTPIGFITR